jgi:hypothetical protein
MALSKGKSVALYFFVLSDSSLRRTLEGRTGPVSAPTALNPPADENDLYNRFKTYVMANFGIAQADLPVNLKKLYVSGGGQNKVATDNTTILAALDGFYNPAQGPCPKTTPDEQAIFAALATALP